MANHKSAEKRLRQEKKRTLHNKYYAKTMRNAVRKLRAMTDKEEALKLYPSVQKMLDKLAKTNIIHKNKASNLKSSLANHNNNKKKFKRVQCVASSFCVLWRVLLLQATACGQNEENKINILGFLYL